MAPVRDRLVLIENISTLVGSTGTNLRETLDAVMAAIAEGMETEVCSLYLFDPTRGQLVLRATVGLDRDSVGKVTMRANEGLVGLAIETMQPVAVADAAAHPRYKYFPETGEERYHAFLGVPMVDSKREPMGVLVAQTLRRRKFTQTDIRLLKTAANQLAQALSHFRLRRVSPQDDRGHSPAQGLREGGRQDQDGGPGQNSAPAIGWPAGITGLQPRRGPSGEQLYQYD
jgi:signal transduction protein with GAF and PtsI domain